MINALNIAQGGLLAASQRLEVTAGAIASSTATPQKQDTEPPTTGAPGVRVGYLPLPQGATSNDPAELMTSMLEDEMSFKMNAVVLKTIADMTDRVYKAVD